MMVSIGYDPIWFGMSVCRMLEIRMITLPFGLNLFGLAGSADVAVGTVYRGIVPFGQPIW